jgi:hypothetical protein
MEDIYDWNDDTITVDGKQYLTVKGMVNKYEITRDAVYVNHHNGHKYIKKINGTLVVDDEALQRRRAFHWKIWNIACDNYYEISEYMPPYRLARLMAKFLWAKPDTWSVYLSTSMFRIDWQDKSVMHYKIPMTLWSVWRFTTFLLRRIKRHNSKIYNRLPNRDNYNNYYTEEQRKWFKIKDEK